MSLRVLHGYDNAYPVSGEEGLCYVYRDGMLLSKHHNAWLAIEWALKQPRVITTSISETDT